MVGVTVIDGSNTPQSASFHGNLTDGGERVQLDGAPAALKLWR